MTTRPGKPAAPGRLKTRNDPVTAALAEYVQPASSFAFCGHSGTVDFDPNYDSSGAPTTHSPWIHDRSLKYKA